MSPYVACPGYESFRVLVELNEDLVNSRNLGSTYLVLPAPVMRLRAMLAGRLDAPGEHSLR